VRVSAWRFQLWSDERKAKYLIGLLEAKPQRWGVYFDVSANRLTYSSPKRAKAKGTLNDF